MTHRLSVSGSALLSACVVGENHSFVEGVTRRLPGWLPVGSPGMEDEGAASEPYDVVAFDSAGRQEIFASYP